MSKHKVDEIRNVAFVGHGHSGKTTLADLLLFKAGIGTRAGSVDDGTSLLDTDDDEKEKKQSLFSHVCRYEHADHRVNLIDCPGYPDFIGQVCGALRAVETAVVVLNANAGLEVNARRCFQLATDEHLARMIVVNRVDGDNVDIPKLVASIRDHWGSSCVPINVPNGTGSKFTAVHSALQIKGDVPAGLPLNPQDYHQALMDAIVEADESLMERFLGGEEVSEDEIIHLIGKAIGHGTLIPIMFTSAKTGVGVQELGDALADYAPTPLDEDHHATGEGGKDVIINPSPDEPFVAQVFKVRIDPFVGKLAYLRVFSGHIAKDTTVQDHRNNKMIKLSNLLEVQGSKSEPVDYATSGDIIAIAKVEDLSVGDTVSAQGVHVDFPPIHFPRPMVGLAVTPKTAADQQKISVALHKIEEEDQTFHVTREAQTHEMVIQGMSDLHLQAIVHRLHKRDKVDVNTAMPRIPYRETCNMNAEGMYRHKKQSGGSGQFAEVHFRIGPLPQGIVPEEYFIKERFESLRSFHYDPVLNYAFVDCVSGGSVPNNFIPAVEKGVKERMEKGVLAGYQVQDCWCVLFFGKDHPVDSNETAFKTAGRQCFKEVFAKAKPVLLEPIVKAEITVPGEKLGDITSDLNTRRGRMEGMDTLPGNFTVVKASVPLAEIQTYARSLSSITGGQGSYTFEPSHYEVVPGNEQQKIVASSKVHEEEE
ncbi:MAG: elongation factor G [Planctomycetes bacterium]|nr:elongation factor G [Planctomycetota bacterium]